MLTAWTTWHGCGDERDDSELRPADHLATLDVMEREKEILPEPVRRRGQRRLIGLGIAGSFNGHLVDQTSSLFLLAVGGGPFHLGLLATLFSLNQAINLPAVLLMRRYGKVALMVRVRVAATAGAIALAVLAFEGTPGPAMVWVAIAVIGARALLMNTGNVAWWPLVRDNTAGSSMPAFLAHAAIGIVFAFLRKTEGYGQQLSLTGMMGKLRGRLPLIPAK